MSAQCQQRSQLDRERVGVESERLHPAGFEFQSDPDGLGVGEPRQIRRLGSRAIRDCCVEHGTVREEVGPPRGDVDRAIEIDRIAEGHLEVRDADPQVVKLHDAAQTDLAIAGTRTALRQCLALAGASSQAAVTEFGLPKGKTVVPDGQAGNDGVINRGGQDGTCHSKLLETDCGRLNDEQLLGLSTMLGSVVIRVVAYLDSGSGDDNHVGDNGLQGGDLECESAGHIKSPGDVKSEQLEYVDFDVKGAQDTCEFSGDATAGLVRT